MKRIVFGLLIMASAIFIASYATNAYLSDQETSTSNNFTAGTWVDERVIITEFMANPSAVADSQGEWFEIYNPTGNSINLKNWRYRDKSGWATINTDLIIPSTGYLVFVQNTNAVSNGGISGGIEFDSTFELTNIYDEIVFERSDGVEIDKVVYNNINYTISAGIANKLNSLILDNSLATSWGQSSTPYGSGDLGTPGGSND